MANQRISELLAVVTPADTDEFAVNQGGVSKKITRAQILSDVPDFGTIAYTSGRILVADGDSYEEVAVSGDATLTSAGVLRVTVLSNGSGTALLTGGTGTITLAAGTRLIGSASGERLMSFNQGVDFPDRSTFVGRLAGNTTMTGDLNSCFGWNSGAALTSGERNTLIGYNAASLLTTGQRNTVLGNAGLALTTGEDNFLLGTFAGGALTTQNNNVFVGTFAGDAATCADSIAIGEAAIRNSTGSDMIGIGHTAGDNATSATDGIIIGADLDFPSATAAGQIVIGNLIFGTGATGDGTTISAGANCGIGTNAPSTRLHVNGPVRVGQYDVAGVPSASTAGAGATIYVSDGAAGAA